MAFVLRTPRQKETSLSGPWRHKRPGAGCGAASIAARTLVACTGARRASTRAGNKGGNRMPLLAAASLLWLAIHIGVSGTGLRARLVRAMGETAFRGGFAIASLGSIVLLVRAYRHGPTIPLWDAPPGLIHALALVMLLAFLLFVASVAAPNPTSAGQEKSLGRTATGVTRITRHPMNCAFALWAAVHMIANGELSAEIFFGTFALTALAGMPSIDRKLAARDPAAWAHLAADTSIVPFAAILAGRNRLALGEIKWFVWVGGAVLWAGMLHGHRYIIGVSALRWLRR